MKRYNLSDIMKRAHYIFNHTFNATFSYCLKKHGLKLRKQQRLMKKTPSVQPNTNRSTAIVTIETTVPITVHAWDVMIGNVIIVTI